MKQKKIRITNFKELEEDQLYTIKGGSTSKREGNLCVFISNVVQYLFDN